MSDPTTAIFEAVRGALTSASEGLVAGHIGLDSRLADLGISSLQLVDLALALEDALGIQEFPLQAWIDAQFSLGEAGFRVQALVDECECLLRPSLSSSRRRRL